jgi:hypothetical protein
LVVEWFSFCDCIREATKEPFDRLRASGMGDIVACFFA